MRVPSSRLFTMALFVCLLNTALHASELSGFFSVSFSESIHQAKFKSLIDCLAEQGIKAKDVRDYDMKKDLYLYKNYVPDNNLFRSVDTVFIKTNPNNGRIKQIFSLLSYASNNDKTRDQALDCFVELIDYIPKRYSPLGVETVSKKDSPTLWAQLTQAQFGTNKSDQPVDCNYFCFKNNSGIITQIITVCMLYDAQNEMLYIKIQAEETAEKHKIIEEEKAEEQRKAAQAKNEKDDKYRRWREEFNARPKIDSFCGIKFGSVLSSYEIVGELEWTRTSVENSNLYNIRMHNTPYIRCLMAEIKLPRPFRGIKTARVYVSGRTRKIFKIGIGQFYYKADDAAAWAVVRRKFNPNRNPYISNGGLDNYYGYVDYSIGLKNAFILCVYERVGTGEFRPTVKEIGDYAIATTEELTTEVYTIQVTHFESGEIAIREDSVDNDGADVL